jgi:hypothetical protein
MSGKPGRRALDRPSARSSFLVLAGFTAVLCWWVSVVGFISTGAGTVFLVLPVIPTVLTLVLARRGSGRKAKHVGPAHGPAVASVISPYRSSMFVLAAFAMALCWWIGIVGVVSSGGGAQVFWPCRRWQLLGWCWLSWLDGKGGILWSSGCIRRVTELVGEGDDRHPWSSSFVEFPGRRFFRFVGSVV